MSRSGLRLSSIYGHAAAVPWQRCEALVAKAWHQRRREQPVPRLSRALSEITHSGGWEVRDTTGDVVALVTARGAVELAGESAYLTRDRTRRKPEENNP